MSVSSTQRIIRGEVTSEGLSGDLPAYYKEHQFSVTLFSDEYQTPVTPTAGTMTISVSDDGFNFGSVTNGTVDVTKSEYNRPTMTGYAKRVKATPAGVAGATHYQVTITSWR